MEKFNNTSIFTGYLKQLLHTYDLPKYKIYTKEHQKYFEEHGQERADIIQTITKTENGFPDNMHYVPYIRYGQIQEYIDGKWVTVGTRNNIKLNHYHDYTEGITVLNYTKNLQIKNNIYDSYTHEYLGDYLRFQRDYNGINLMPLYNCFSDRACDALDISFKLSSTATNYLTTDLVLGDLNNDADILKQDTDTNFAVRKDNKFIQITKNNIARQKSILGTATNVFKQLPPVQNTVIFNTNDSNYKIYMVPIKLFQKYTIAIDSDLPIELCCGMYGAYQDKRTRFADIPKNTYQKLTSSKFNQPFLYTNFYTFCENNVANLTEISQNENNLKLFIKIPQNNTSTIIILEGDYTRWNDKIFMNNAKVIQNSAVINFEKFDCEKLDFPLYTSLQLLHFNTHYQIPFADRLIEYLVGNVITSTDELQKNIMRVQKAVIAGTVDNTIYNYIPKNDGIWEDDIKFIIYDYLNNINATADINHDILGYIDKDTEKLYSYLDKNKKPVSLANTEIDSGEDL